MSFETNASQYEYPANAEGIREFHIGDILSITTGYLLSPRHMDGIYDILDYMTGDELSTLQLPRASRECESSLREQHPDLAAVDVPERFEGLAHVDRWLGDLVLKHGEKRVVMPLDPEEHTVIDVITEAQMMGLGDKIIMLDLSGEPPLPEDPYPTV